MKTGSVIGWILVAISGGFLLGLALLSLWFWMMN